MKSTLADPVMFAHVALVGAGTVVCYLMDALFWELYVMLMDALFWELYVILLMRSFESWP